MTIANTKHVRRAWFWKRFGVEFPKGVHHNRRVRAEFGPAAPDGSVRGYFYPSRVGPDDPDAAVRLFTAAEALLVKGGLDGGSGLPGPPPRPLRTPSPDAVREFAASARNVVEMVAAEVLALAPHAEVAVKARVRQAVGLVDRFEQLFAPGAPSGE